MIATMSLQSHRMSPSMEHLFSRNMNTAGAPLPLIPRRIPSGARSRSTPSSPQNYEFVSVTPVKVFIQHSTPPQTSPPSTSTAMSDSDSSSSSSSPSDGTRPTVTIRSKRVRGVRSSAVCPPEQSTPTPALHHARLAHEQHSQPHHAPASAKDDDSTPRQHARPLIYTPGMSLRPQTEGMKARNFSESHVRASTESPASTYIPPSSSYQKPYLVRKKSGQLVKSSLKSSKSLSVIVKGVSSKSEPNTPTHTKAVHFDSKLEHVKLFLAEQKPLAVSRDGSPTDDTSGTDSDFPSFIFGDTRKTLEMKVPNMPRCVDRNADVALEELALAPDAMSIVGRARVRNIAYSKWLVARFTFDEWQTTSEVTAKYLDSVDSEFDRFVFTIRLNDLLARIGEKRLYLALRYTVAGRELWDNNRGKNYLAEFSRIVPSPVLPKVKGRISEDESSATESDIADLKDKLEKVALGQEKKPTSLSSSFLSQSLATRYDFGTSLKEPWNPSTEFTSPLRHLRTQSYPTSSVTTTPAATPATNSIPWPDKPKGGYLNIPDTTTPVKKRTPIPSLGSPRDLGEDAPYSAIPRSAELDDTPFPVPVPVTVAHEGRNHRRSYFDDANAGEGRASSFVANVRRTPPGTPSFDDTTPMPPSRFHSFPPVKPQLYGLGLGTSVYGDREAGSGLSTPSFASPSSGSSRETSPSPTEDYMMMNAHGYVSSEEEISPSTHYTQFLSKFCFFTGTGAGTHPISPDLIPRTHSESDIEEFLNAASTSPRISASDSFNFATPIRSPSLDDIMSLGGRSGSSTPTKDHYFTPPKISSPPLMFSESRSATPIAV
ncbi:hypothetical protein Hypma_008575 [Hypsizygus marmoreus]|uniref:CBM21 domain-containing protein n=1 Tax=Hypsizygus marmoreus TaxID=39966 RepID=A0A369JSQ9_HYPMA|nr:hypothetical protein Hypma_008575 [Hypsizygus marmoreus]